MALTGAYFCFRVLRGLWERHESSRPLLALLLALARDPLLRATATAVLRTPHGHEFARQPMTEALSEVAGDRLNEAILDKVVRNAVLVLDPVRSPARQEQKDQTARAGNTGRHGIRAAAGVRMR